MRNVITQQLKDIIIARLEELSLKILKKELEPLDINLFMHKNKADIDFLQYQVKHTVDTMVTKYLEELKHKDKTHENSSI